MTKQEAIKTAWEAEGLKWEQIKSWVNMDYGGLILSHPSIKYEIDGYEKGHKDGRSFWVA